MLVKEKTVKSKNVKINSIYKNMFVELFYPKELRRLIEKYRKEGTLNETIVKKLRKNIYVGVTVCSILFWILSYKLSFYWLVILFFLTLFLIKQEIHGIFYRNIAPYVNGNKVKAKVIKSGIGGKAGNFLYVLYELTTYDSKIMVNCQAVVTPSYTLKRNKLTKEDSIPQKGQTYFIYQSNLDKSKGMPDIKFFKENYSLTTSIL